MVEFDEQIYLDEMQALLVEARRRWLNDQAGVMVFTVSVWTDPGAAASAVSFDTYENSVRKVSAGNEWAETKRQFWLDRGDPEMAALFEPRSGRNGNPADFAFASFAEIEHRSFVSHWEETTDGACWDVLEPALLIVLQAALRELDGLPLHADAELGVNSRVDWYAVTRRFR